MSRPSINTNLLISNDNYDDNYQLPGDAVIGIQHQVSRTHYIQDNAPETYTYTSYFYVTNKLPISLSEVSIWLASGESPDQPNVQTQFQQPDGSWAPDLEIDIGRIEGNTTSARQTFTMRIIRTMPGGALNTFTLNTYFNPSYSVEYSSPLPIWNSTSQVVPK